MTVTTAKTMSLLHLPYDLIHEIAVHIHPHKLQELRTRLCKSAPILLDFANDISFAKKQISQLVATRTASAQKKQSVLSNLGFAVNARAGLKDANILNDVNFYRLPKNYTAAIIAMHSLSYQTMPLVQPDFFRAGSDSTPPNPRPDTQNFLAALELVCGFGTVDVTTDYNLLLRYLASLNAAKLLERFLEMHPCLNGEILVALLKTAARSGATDVVRWLIASKFVDAAGEDNAAIRVACERGQVECVRALLESGTILLPKGSDSGIVLEHGLLIKIAALNGHTDVVKLLIEDWRKWKRSAATSASGDGNGSIRLNMEDLEDALIGASRNGWLEVVKMILEEWSWSGEITGDDLAIKLAAREGHVEIVKLLLTADPPPTPQAVVMALGLAAENGHTMIVKLLLDAGADPCGGQNYALHQASVFGHADVLKLLVQTGRIDPTCDDCFALRRSAVRGHTEVVRMLLEIPAVNRCLNEHDSDDDEIVEDIDSTYTPSLITMRLRSTSLVIETSRALEEATSDSEKTSLSLAILHGAATAGHANIVELILKTKPKPRTVLRSLRAAIESGNTDSVNLLLEHYDSMSIGYSHRHQLSEAVRITLPLAGSRGHSSTINLILRKPQWLLDTLSDLTLTAATMQAIANGHEETSLHILSTGRVDVKEGESIMLQQASRFGLLRAVRALLELGADPACSDNGPLRFAACGGIPGALIRRTHGDGRRGDPSRTMNIMDERERQDRAEIVSLLLASGKCDTSSRGNEALLNASESGNEKVIELLLRYGIDLKCNGTIALQRAAARGHLAIVRTLLQTNQVDPMADCCRAIVDAAASGWVDVVDELIKAGAIDRHSADVAVWRAGANHWWNVVLRLYETGLVDVEGLKRLNGTGNKKLAWL